jgi:hypothetical protein
MEKTTVSVMRELQELLETKVDWARVHWHYALGNSGQQICIHTDGSISILGPNEHYDDRDKAGVVYVLRARGIDNLEMSYYADGWTRFDPYTEEYIIDYGVTTADQGRRLTKAQVVKECIEEGEHSQLYQSWISNALLTNRQVDNLVLRETLNQINSMKHTFESWLREGMEPALVLRQARSIKYLGGIWAKGEDDIIACVIEYAAGLVTYPAAKFTEADKRVFYEVNRLQRKLEQLVIEKALADLEGTRWKFIGTLGY